jgi:hypothetical protein
MRSCFAAAIAIALINLGYAAHAQNTDDASASEPQPGYNSSRSWANVSSWEADYLLSASADNVPCAPPGTTCTIKQSAIVQKEVLRKGPFELQWIGIGRVAGDLNDVARFPCPAGSKVSESILTITAVGSSPRGIGKSDDLLTIDPVHKQYVYEAAPGGEVRSKIIACNGNKGHITRSNIMYPATEWPLTFSLPNKVERLTDGQGPHDKGVFFQSAVASWSFHFTLIPHFRF